MNQLAKGAARQVTLWLVLLFVVCVSTLLFTLLGVLFTAVLTGIIMGASRRWLWQAVPVSLVFPLVTFALGQVAQESLQPGQRVAMVALGFGTFWVIYIASLGLMRLERQPVPAAEAPSSEQSAAATEELSGTEGASQWTAAVSGPGDGESSHLDTQLNLHDFEGTWFCETTGPDGEFRTCLMTVAEGRFALEVRNPRGLVAEGVLSLEQVTRGHSLLVSPESPVGACPQPACAGRRSAISHSAS